RLLPVPLRGARSRRRPLVGFSHFWVLHHKKATRLLLLALICLVLGFAYVFRADVEVGLEEAGRFVGARLVDAGFGIASISMTGQALTREAQVLDALSIDATTSIFSLDAAGVQARLEALASVEAATVRKI